MSKEACSEDEAFIKDNQLYYQRVRPVWRNPTPDVEAWFRTFDLLHMSTRYDENGKRKPGRLPRHRLQATGPQTSTPASYPKCLPQNFYDDTWLDTLDQFEKKQLKIQPHLELIFDDSIQRFVEELNSSFPVIDNQSLALWTSIGPFAGKLWRYGDKTRCFDTASMMKCDP